tara:strand:+ start:302 stop:616 length:315 start_codon:yes stop_codon:yes gene_type:complete
LRIIRERKRSEQLLPTLRRTAYKPPHAPDWLHAEALPYWSMLAVQMTAARAWPLQFETTLGTYCTLFSYFDRDPAKFGASRLPQMRLLAGDLGLSHSYPNRGTR